MDYSLQQFKADILDADMILVGIGEEFEITNELNLFDEYNTAINYLKDADKHWMEPLVNNFYMKKYSKEWEQPYEKLFHLLKDKNYFVVTTAKNNALKDCNIFDHNKIVMPCGSFKKVQCRNGCEDSLKESKEIEFNNIKLLKGEIESEIGSCSHCGKEYQFNNIFCENYLEQGYLPQWEKYLKWMQGTLNKKLLLIELGVSLAYPSVIRWPFEKTAFFNQKAKLYRVNKNLYHMTEELQDKGISIPMSAITFLKNL